MGIGKSTLGKGLAGRLGIPFLDIDKEIERHAQKTIADIFASEGESSFRQAEREALIRLSVAYTDGVFATGGGLPCHADNMELLKDLGPVLYLRASDQSIATRLLSSKGKRPLIAGKSASELRAFVHELLAVRAPIYEQATEIIDLNLDEHAPYNVAQVHEAVIALQS